MPSEHLGTAGKVARLTMIRLATTRSDPMTTPPPGRVLCIGETLIDLIVNDGAPDLLTAGSLAIREGGALANAAVALARLGVPSGFCGVIGLDTFGERLRQTLASNGVDVTTLRATADAPTTLAFAWKDARGDGHFSFLRMADGLLAVEDIDAARIASCRAVLVGSVVLPVPGAREAIYAAVAQAGAAGVPVVFDVNFRPALWDDPSRALAVCEPVLAGATVLKLSLDDARALLGEGEPEAVLRRAATLPPPITVLTDGARGCWTLSGSGEVIHVPVFSVDAIEPTGAGDAFTAALISHLIANGWQPPAADDLRYAAAAGALATTRPGALDGLPTRSALDQFLADRH